MACAACLGTGTVMFAAVNDVALCTAHAQGQGQPRPLYLTGDEAHMAQFQENAAWL